VSTSFFLALGEEVEDFYQAKLKITIVGRNSALSRSIVKLQSKSVSYEFVSLSELSKLGKHEFSRTISNLAQTSDAILWLGAILDTSHPEPEVKRINFSLPLFAATCLKRDKYRGQFMTVGSALEQLEIQAPYFQWKTRLAYEAKNTQRQELWWTHVRAHTLVGLDKPRIESFLGQLVIALRFRSPFVMHGTSQVRRFHDLDGFAEAILGQVLLKSEIPSITTLGPPQSLNLFELATEAATLVSPNLPVLLDTSSSWGQDQTRHSLVENDLTVTGGLDLKALLGRIKSWIES
jgi:hypothetical protein